MGKQHHWVGLEHKHLRWGNHPRPFLRSTSWNLQDMLLDKRLLLNNLHMDQYPSTKPERDIHLGLEVECTSDQDPHTLPEFQAQGGIRQKQRAKGL